MQRDFQGITALANAPLVLVVHRSLPVRSTRELIARAGQPGAINYASGGSGSAAHMAAELFKSMTCVNLVHVPYKGTAPALADLVGGHVSVAFYTLSAIGGHVKAGRLRPLALTALERCRSARERQSTCLPHSLARRFRRELAYRAYPKTPRELIDRLRAEIIKILVMPEIKERVSSLGFSLIANTPRNFRRRSNPTLPSGRKSSASRSKG